MLKKNLNEIFVRFVNFFKQYELSNFKSKYSRLTLNAEERERAVPYPDFALYVSAVKLSGEKTEAANSRAGLQALRPREFKGGLRSFVYVSNADILINIFT